LFLLPTEVGFLRYLKAAKVPLNEYEFPANKIANIQSQLERLIEKNYYLASSAKDAFASYLQSYASHSLKKIFDVQSLDLKAVGKSFGFSVPPSVHLPVGSVKHKSHGKGTSKVAKAAAVYKRKSETHGGYY
jgi:ATP-dependent RNA helicase DDX18/HAS1